MSNLRASITCGTTENTVLIKPIDGTSLRSLERALSGHGVPVIVLRGLKQVCFPISEFLKAQDALQGWDLDIDPTFLSVTESLLGRERSIRLAKAVIEEVTNEGTAEALLQDFPESNKLDPHQLQAVAAITHPEVRGICLFDEQGLGKTITTLFSFHRLKQLGEVTRLLVIAPKNMVYEWENDTKRFFGGQYRIQPVVGTEREKRTSLNRRADVYVTNFETTVQLTLRLKDLLDSERGRALLVVDESFFVKNSNARRTRAIRRLRKSVNRCIVLCGTPVPNSPHDIVEQFNIADDGITFQGVSLPIDRDGARPIVQHIIDERGVYIRRLKQDVLRNLPNKTFHRVYVPLQPAQGRVYIAALENLIHDLQIIDDIAFNKNVTSFMAKRTALLQICSNPSSVTEGYKETPAKLLALDSILEELITRQDEKVVVWSFFTASLDAIFRRYNRFNPVRIDGTVVQATARREAIRRFQSDDETMLFVANPAAAGAGITLHRARYAVYESMSNQAAHYLQSLDRVHRRGQTRPVEYLILLCDNTIEVPEYDRLIQKERSAQELLGDRIEQPITRSAMLSEAMTAAQLIGLDMEVE